ncbi:MAG: hypothetical protein QMD03_00655 [Syntrophales bacterium]|nr:hypothetical protein [Syntrophales bacterium]
MLVFVFTIATAKLLGLSFISITRESFGMLLDQFTFFEKGVQAFIEILNAKEFRSRAEWVGGYDFEDSGKIRYSVGS